MKFKFRKTSKVDTQQEKACSSRLSFDTLIVSVPYPKRYSVHGEDAAFANAHAIGVFDGVGGSTTTEVNAGQYARRLATNIEGRLRPCKKAPNLHRIVKKVIKHTQLGGSSTVCCTMLHEHNLHVFNVGDSGLVIVRNNKIVLSNKAQRHLTNTPFQVSFRNHADLASGQRIKFSVKPGDILILATDGFWDNLFVDKILETLSSFVISKEGALPLESSVETHAFQMERLKDQPLLKHSSTWKYMMGIANSLADQACAISHSFTTDSPYAKLADSSAFGFGGGKMDDITFCLAKITDRSETHHHRISGTCPIRSPSMLSERIRF